MAYIENKDFLLTKAYFGKHYFKRDYYRILEEKDLDDWRISFAYQDDFFIDQYLILNKGDLAKDVRVELSDLRSDEAIIAKDNIKIYFTKDTKASIGVGRTWGVVADFPCEVVPDILDYSNARTLEPKSLRAFYIVIRTDIDTPAGLYRGEIKLSYGSEILALDINLKILGLRVMNNDFTINYWQYPFTTARYYEIPEDELFENTHLNILREHLKVYKNVGGNSITTTIVEDPWMQQTYDKYPSMIRTVEKDGNLTFDYRYFDTYVDLALSEGIDGQILAFTMAEWFDHRRDGRGLEPAIKEWEDYWDYFLDDFITHLDKKGYFDRTYIAVDERSEDLIEACLKILKRHPNKDGKVLKIASQLAFNKDYIKTYDKIDDLCFNYLTIDEVNIAYIRARKEKGLTTTMYTCTGMYPNSFALSEPIESDWTILYANSIGADGYLRWAYDAWVKGPLIDVSHWWWEAGDTALIYPSDNEGDSRKPRLSPRLLHLTYGRNMVGKINYLFENLSEKELIDFAKEIDILKRPAFITNSYGQKQADVAVMDELYRQVIGIYNAIYSYSLKLV